MVLTGIQNVESMAVSTATRRSLLVQVMIVFESYLWFIPRQFSYLSQNLQEDITRTRLIGLTAKGLEDIIVCQLSTISSQNNINNNNNNTDNK